MSEPHRPPFAVETGPRHPDTLNAMGRGGPSRPSEVLAERLRSTRSGRIVVLIDGGSGAGKSTLAEELGVALGAQVVSLDRLYPGWGGLEVGSAMVRSSVLDPDKPGYRRWDWKKHAPAEWHKVHPRKDLVIEGSGSLSAANRRLATYGIWVHLDYAERKRRAIRRDGAAYLEHWDRWEQQEHAFYLRERPDLLADAILDNVTGELHFREPAPTA